MAQALSAAAVDGDLAHALATFQRAAQRLEVSYRDLKERAASIDHELQATNRALQGALGDRERLLAALPLGVLSFSADGALTWRNGVAVDLLGDVDPAAVGGWAAGERDVGGRRLQVRRAAMADAGVLLLLEDRSQVAHLTREVDRLDRLAALSELALGIAHEIKNPLNGVCGFAALLRRSDDPTEMRRHAQRIGDGLAQVDCIVRELLAFARPGDALARPLTLQQALHEATQAAGLARERVHASGALDATVDGAVLVRVLTNLLRNAAEAAGDDARVTITSACGPHGLEVRVRDNGPGVAAELAPRLFRPFVSTKARGHGLGLALSARVLSFLHGSLTLSNPGERGAEFVIGLPPARPAEVTHGA